MNLEKSFIDFIKKESLYKPGENLLIAVSGGVDSVVLCELCHRAGFHFSIAHAHFGLRGKDSDADADFVRSLASKYQVPFFIRHFNTLEEMKSSGNGLQQTARELRYHWFLRLLEGENEEQITMSHLLTAHHADDQAETMLMHFLKGTGLSGLRGMLPGDSGIGARVVRPLLFASKKDILAYAQQEKLEWREDVSNTKTDYTRNAIRLNIIPSLLELFPTLIQNMQKSAGKFRALELWVDEILQEWKRKNEFAEGAELKWPISQIIRQKGKAALLYELIAPFGFSSGQIKDALQLLTSENGKYIQSSSHRLIRNRKWLVVSPVLAENATRIPVEKDNNEVGTLVGTFIFETIENVDISKDSNTAELDATMIQFPLWIRPWAPGDYFYPLGLPKKKKISRFLIDQKLSKPEKERVWVVESDKKIIWVSGLRIDHRFRVKDKTQKRLRITLVSSK